MKPLQSRFETVEKHINDKNITVMIIGLGSVGTVDVGPGIGDNGTMHVGPGSAGGDMGTVNTGSVGGDIPDR